MSTQDLISQARAAKRTALDELDGKRLLASFGIPVPKSVVVQDATEAAAACGNLKPPLVLKVVSPDILHKSDAGGVKVGLKSAAEVEDAVRAMMKRPAIQSARIDGFLLEEMAPAGLEVVVGGLRDPQFGPLVMVGLGGIFVEVLADVSFRICPIARLDAEEMLEELKGAALLRGARGRNPVSREAIVDALLKVGGESGLMMTHGDDIAEADINPIIVSEHAAVAVDARFVLSQPPMNADKNL
jgi:acyl-CoA synthetase (NDP forming)